MAHKPKKQNPNSAAADMAAADKAAADKAAADKAAADKAAADKAQAEADAKATTEAAANAVTGFPLAALKQGACVARAAWAPGYTLKLGMKGNRGKSELCFFQTGSRSGEIEWKPKGIADLLAEDWRIIVPAPPIEEATAA